MTQTAIIVGAGLGGLATARALESAGWDVRVLEAADEVRATGSGIGLTDNGLAALDAIGNGGNNRLFGNAGANVVSGGAGGADLCYGLGGADRQWMTMTMYLYELGWGAQKSFGRAAAVAWILFGIIIAIGLVNFLLTQRIASGDTPRRVRKGART